MNKFVAIGRCKVLMTQHGLSDRNWAAVINPDLNRRLAQCVYPNGDNKGRIEISAIFIDHNEMPVVEGTILHEIAHALLPPGCGHNHIWKAKAVQIGADPNRLCSEATMPHGPWQTRCPSCSMVFSKHRQPKPGLRICRRCGRRRGTLPPYQFVGNNGLLHVPSNAASIPKVAQASPAPDVRQMVRDFIAKHRDDRAAIHAYILRIVEAYPRIAADIIQDHFGAFPNG